MQGVVKNPTSSAATYRIQITYTDAQSTIQAVEKTTVQVSAGQASPWRTTWQTPTSTGIVCVLDAVSRS
jgi:inosine-uridine nucleoside N-ribohydrolase